MWNTLRLYILLKNECDGMMWVNENDIINFSNELNITTRTIHTHLKKLQDRDWIGYDNKSKYYFIRGWNRIKQLEGLNNRTIIKFKLENIKDLQTFKASLIGVYIGYLIYGKNKQLRLNKRTGSDQNVFHSISSIVLGSSLNVSQVMAWKYLRLAEIKGFLNAKKNNLISLNKHVSLYVIEQLKNKIYNNDSTIRIKNNQLFYQSANQYSTDFKYKTNRNLLAI